MALGSFFSRLKEGLSRSTQKLAGGITAVFKKRRLDDEALEELEELLISADLGTAAAAKAFVAQARGTALKAWIGSPGVAEWGVNNDGGWVLEQPTPAACAARLAAALAAVGRALAAKLAAAADV